MRAKAAIRARKAPNRCQPGTRPYVCTGDFIGDAYGLNLRWFDNHGMPQQSYYTCTYIRKIVAPRLAADSRFLADLATITCTPEARETENAPR